MEQLSGNNDLVQLNRPVPTPEQGLEFPEANMSIDPHHGIDTTYRKLFVGGLAWQVRPEQQPDAATAMESGSSLHPFAAH